MSALRELLAVFKIEVEAEELEKASKKVSGFVDYLKTIGPIMAEAFAIGALTEFVGETIEAGARVVDLSNRLGIGTQALQEWQFAARTAGIEAESAAHSLAFLNRSAGEAVLGGKEQTQAFQKLGVSLATLKSGDTGEILDQVADGIAKLQTQPERAAYAMKLFGREGQQLLPILAQGSKGLDGLREEFQELGGGMSEQFVKDAKKADDAFAGLKVGVQSLKSRIVGAMLPAIEAMTTKAKAWIKTGAQWLDQTNILDHGLKALALISGLKLVSTLTKLAKVFGLLKPSIWQTVLSLLGFAIPIALIGLFVLLIEDLWTAIEGGDSVIGDMLTQLAGVEGKDAFVRDLTEAWTELKEVWASFTGGDFNPLAAVGASIRFIVGGFYELIEIGKTFFDLLVGMADVVSSIVIGFGKLGSAFSAMDKAGEGDKGFFQELKDIGGAVKSAFSGVGGAEKEGKASTRADIDAILNPGKHWQGHPAATTIPGAQFDKGPGAASVGPITYGAPKAAPTAGHTVNQKNSINVNVTGGKDAKATGQAVGAGVASELEQQNYSAAEALESM